MPNKACDSRCPVKQSGNHHNAPLQHTGSTCNSAAQALMIPTYPECSTGSAATAPPALSDPSCQTRTTHKYTIVVHSHSSMCHGSAVQPRWRWFLLPMQPPDEQPDGLTARSCALCAVDAAQRSYCSRTMGTTVRIQGSIDSCKSRNDVPYQLAAASPLPILAK
jgi:hypothetical protein